ncbi:MAG TPA: DUF6624 domain-containing protein [Pedobacter sp.]
MKTSLIFALIVLSSIIDASAQRKLNQTLIDSLDRWAAVDQIAAKSPEGKYKQMSQEQLLKFEDSVFTSHQILLSKVFNKYGFPGYDLVGKKGSNQFWLMVQHCDKQPKFQQKVLVAMKKEVIKGNADPKNFAYLTDRVKLNLGHKQIYGTQVTYNTDSCQAIPRLLYDSLRVNQRRKEVGLEPIEAYLNQMSELQFMMNRANYENKGIKGPKIVKVP